jgi:hypothetical protein
LAGGEASFFGLSRHFPRLYSWGDCPTGLIRKEMNIQENCIYTNPNESEPKAFGGGRSVTWSRVRPALPAGFNLQN